MLIVGEGLGGAIAIMTTSHGLDGYAQTVSLTSDEEKQGRFGES